MLMLAPRKEKLERKPRTMSAGPRRPYSLLLRRNRNCSNARTSDASAHPPQILAVHWDPGPTYSCVCKGVGMTHQERLLIGIDEVMCLTRLSRSSIYRRRRAGTFPIPVSHGTARTSPLLWYLDEILEYVESMPRRDIQV